MDPEASAASDSRRDDVIDVKLRATLTPPQNPLSALNSLRKTGVRAVAFRVQRWPLKKKSLPKQPSRNKFFDRFLKTFDALL